MEEDISVAARGFVTTGEPENAIKISGVSSEDVIRGWNFRSGLKVEMGQSV